MRKNVVFFTTIYQIKMFSEVVEMERISNIYVFVSKELFPYIEKFVSYKDVYVYDFERGHIGFFLARRLIADFKKAAERFRLGRKDVFWTANDDDPLVQAAYNIVKFESVCFVEDGLGSYLKYGFFCYEGGLRSIVRKIKHIIYFFPYYRAFYGVAGNLKGGRAYSYSDLAYPMQKNIERQIVSMIHSREHLPNLAVSGSAIFVGQPLYQIGMISKSSYCRYINYVKEKHGDNFVYVSHPGERDTSWLVKKGIRVVYNKGVSLEDYVYSSGDDLKIYGFCSTAMMNVVKMENVKEVVAFHVSDSKKNRLIEEVVKRSGIKVVSGIVDVTV